MIIQPIRNDDELKSAFQRLEIVFQAKVDTTEPVQSGDHIKGNM